MSGLARARVRSLEIEHGLVSRFRSSHHCAATSFANFGIEGHWQLIDLVWLWFRSPHFGLAARMMRTSEPPHWDIRALSQTVAGRPCGTLTLIWRDFPPDIHVQIAGQASAPLLAPRASPVSVGTPGL